MNKMPDRKAHAYMHTSDKQVAGRRTTTRHRDRETCWHKVSGNECHTICDFQWPAVVSCLLLSISCSQLLHAKNTAARPSVLRPPPLHVSYFVPMSVSVRCLSVRLTVPVLPFIIRRRPLPEISFGCLRSIQREQPRINLLCRQELHRRSYATRMGNAQRRAGRKGNIAHDGVRLTSWSGVWIDQRGVPVGRVQTPPGMPSIWNFNGGEVIAWNRPHKLTKYL